MAVFKESGLVVFYKFKEGNDNGVRVDILRDVFSKFPAPSSIGSVLLYSEYYTSEVINYFEDAGVMWAIGSRRDEAVMGEIAHIDESCWSKLRSVDGIDTDCEVTETVHIMGKCKRAFRLVIKRWLPQNQEGLFENVYSYRAIATNAEDISAQEVVWLYNQRSCFENNIKELKGGFGMSYMPSGDFAANGVYFAIGVLAYNLFIAQKLLTLPQSWRHKTIASIRWMFIETAGKFVRHAGQVVLKLAVDAEKFIIFNRARERLAEIEGG